MVTYIYFVKCPNCEDEHFDFFDDAKAFARSCISQKPIITQTEVCRNDFGECTDHSDLGTVWSWEDECEPEVETPTFARDDLGEYDPDNDPEFQEDDDFRLINEELLESRRISFNNKADQQEFFKLCKETGMITAADLDRFMKDHDADDGDLLNALRAYKDELDLADAVEESCKPVKEDFVDIYDYDHMTKDELYDRLVNEHDIVEIEIGDQGYSLADTGSFSDGGRYSDSRLDVEFENGKFIATEWYMSDDGDSKEGDWTFETESFDELWDQLMEFRPEGLVEKCTKEARKPVPDGMTIEQLKETMEENEDMIECAGCEELFPKEDCFHKEGIGWLCGNCEDRIVKCTWCDELYDRGECRYEVDLGWLCDRCEAAIKSRGETLTFREGNYWDFLDEAVADKPGYKHYKITYKAGVDPVRTTYFTTNRTDVENAWKRSYLGDRSAKISSIEEVDASKVPAKVFQHNVPVDLEYKKLSTSVRGTQYDADDWDEWDLEDDFTYEVPQHKVATAIWENFLTEEDVAGVPGGMDALYDDNDLWEDFLVDHLDDLVKKYYQDLLDYFEEDAKDAFAKKCIQDWEDRWYDYDED